MMSLITTNERVTAIYLKGAIGLGWLNMIISDISVPQAPSSERPDLCRKNSDIDANTIINVNSAPLDCLMSDTLSLHDVSCFVTSSNSRSLFQLVYVLCLVYKYEWMGRGLWT